MMKKLVFNAFFAVVLAVTALSVACSADNETEQETTGEGFAIYLTKNDVEPQDLIMMSHIEPANEPVLTVDDIVSYDAQTHEIQLEQSGTAKLALIEVPVHGKSFVVCVDGAPVYTGAFWSMLSSSLFEGVTIFQTMGFESESIKLTLGYPTEEFYTGRDIRNDATIMKSLKEYGKLVNELPTSLIDELPASMKGYELYSWQEGEDWHFRLITGTNRNKTYEEITEGENTLESMVSIHAVGIEGIESVLGKLPVNSEVFWLTENALTETGEKAVILPEESVTQTIHYYCDICVIQLSTP